MMDRNVKHFTVGWSYCFHDNLTCAKAGIRAQKAGCTIEYFFNKYGNPSFLVLEQTSQKEKES